MEEKDGTQGEMRQEWHSAEIMYLTCEYYPLSVESGIEALTTDETDASVVLGGGEGLVKLIQEGVGMLN